MIRHWKLGPLHRQTWREPMLLVMRTSSVARELQRSSHTTRILFHLATAPATSFTDLLAVIYRARLCPAAALSVCAPTILRASFTTANPNQHPLLPQTRLEKLGAIIKVSSGPALCMRGGIVRRPVILGFLYKYWRAGPGSVSHCSRQLNNSLAHVPLSHLIRLEGHRTISHAVGSLQRAAALSLRCSSIHYSAPLAVPDPSLLLHCRDWPLSTPV